jgi:hypothetical protein
MGRLAASRDTSDVGWSLPRHRWGTFKQAADQSRILRERRWFDEGRELRRQIDRLKDQITVLKNQLAALDDRRCAHCAELDGHHSDTCTAAQAALRVRAVDRPEQDQQQSEN